MNEVFIGGFAVSKAGHDFGKLYVIIQEDKEYLYLVDGKIRTLERPKKKKRKHVTTLKYHDESLMWKIKQGAVRDEEIRKAIKLLQRGNSGKEVEHVKD